MSPPAHLQYVAAADEQPPARARAGAHKHCGGRRQAQGAGAGNDQDVARHLAGGEGRAGGGVSLCAAAQLLYRARSEARCTAGWWTGRVQHAACQTLQGMNQPDAGCRQSPHLKRQQGGGCRLGGSGGGIRGKHLRQAQAGGGWAGDRQQLAAVTWSLSGCACSRGTFCSARRGCIPSVPTSGRASRSTSAAVHSGAPAGRRECPRRSRRGRWRRPRPSLRT